MILAHKVEGDLTQESQVARGGAVTHPAVIFAEGDIKDPVQTILNAPVSPDRLDQDSWIILAADRK